MNEIISGTIAVVASSLAIFLSADMLAESINDGLKETGGALPLLSQGADAISPFGIMFLFYPLCLGACACYYLLSSNKRDADNNNTTRSSMVWHLIAILASVFAVSLALTLASFFTYLDGHRVPSTIQWVGNGIICAVITSGIIYAVKKHRENRT